MRLYVRNDPLAQTYFDLRLPEVSHSPETCRDTRPVGELFRTVVEPFRLGILYEHASGGLWLAHVGLPGTPQYVNADLNVLREACQRWLAARQAGSGYDEFLGWLYATDPECARWERDFPYTFWASEVGDVIDPFGPLDDPEGPAPL